MKQKQKFVGISLIGLTQFLVSMDPGHDAFTDQFLTLVRPHYTENIDLGSNIDLTMNAALHSAWQPAPYNNRLKKQILALMARYALTPNSTLNTSQKDDLPIFATPFLMSLSLYISDRIMGIDTSASLHILRLMYKKGANLQHPLIKQLCSHYPSEYFKPLLHQTGASKKRIKHCALQ